MNKQKPKGLIEEGTKVNSFASKINANKFFEDHKINEPSHDLGDYKFYDDVNDSPLVEHNN